MRYIFSLIFLVAATLAASACSNSEGGNNAASTPTQLSYDSDNAVQRLISTNPAAQAIARRAKAVLIFPNIVKGGFVFGGAYGEGELKEHRGVTGYYNMVNASWGLQIGAQSYSYVMFLMNNRALRYLHESHGWEIGTGPTVVLVNAGVAKELDTTSLQKDVYAFVFDQQGLMGSLSLEGTKITRIRNP